MVPLSADRALGEEAVAPEQAGVVNGQVVAVPAARAVPPDLVSVLAVRRRAVKVTDGQVLHPDIARPHLDPVHTPPMPAVDDHAVPVEPTHVQIRRSDHDRLGIDAGANHDPVARLRPVHCRLDRSLVRVRDLHLRNDVSGAPDRGLHSRRRECKHRHRRHDSGGCSEHLTAGDPFASTSAAGPGARSSASRRWRARSSERPARRPSARPGRARSVLRPPAPSAGRRGSR
jgi:hypothetical protein